MAGAGGLLDGGEERVMGGSFYRGEQENEYGTPVSVFECFCCRGEFTVCPAVAAEKRHLYERDGCGDAECDTYDPGRDAGVLLGDYTMFNRYCERKGLDPKALSHLLMAGGPEALRRTEMDDDKP